jgi:hypothetical protein
MGLFACFVVLSLVTFSLTIPNLRAKLMIVTEVPFSEKFEKLLQISSDINSVSSMVGPTAATAVQVEGKKIICLSQTTV